MGGPIERDTAEVRPRNISARWMAKLVAGISASAARGISNAFDKGSNGNGYWLAVGIALWGLRKFLRMAQRVDEVVYSETLVPGQRLTIKHLHDDFLSID